MKANLDGDLEAYLSFYTDDAIVMPPFNPILNGKEGLIDSWYEQRRNGTK